jgi:SAM-dependent methyltransferase
VSISAEDAALDLGCGMGGAMITLARFPFRRVDGVEISPRLVQVAERNLDRLRITKSRVFQSDAADFKDYDPYSFIYMYNPFHRVVVETVLRNLCDSQRRRPRAITLIYKAADAEDLVLGSRFRKVREFDHCQPAFVVYVSDSN